MATPAPKRLRVTNFRRVSTTRQENERQKYDLLDNEEQFNLEVMDTIELKVSGPKVRKSKEWVDMIASMKIPDYRDGINISALDRLLRPEDFDIIGEAFSVFAKYKKVIVSTKEGQIIEPWTPRGWEICMQAMLQAGKELAELKRRTKGGRRKAHAESKPMNTAPCYGLLYIDKYSKDSSGRSQYYIEDPEPSSYEGMSRREIVQMFFDWRHVERMKTYRMAARANSLGILTAGKRKKDGSWQHEPGLWSRQTMAVLLRNRHYVGEHWEGGVLVKNVPCPQFIDREIFDAVQASFIPAKQSRLGRASAKRLLSDFLRCDRCKNRMYIQKGAYRCLTRDARRQVRACSLKPAQVVAAIIEPVVWTAIWKYLTDPALLLANARAFYEERPSDGSLSKLEAELTEVKGCVTRLQDMIEHNRMDPETGGVKIDGHMKRQREIEAELRAAGSVINLPTLKQAQSACRKIAEGPEPSRFETQRIVLDQLVDLDVRYDGEFANISGKIPVHIPRQKCNSRVNDGCTSVLFIPFKIKERVAA